ncbi:MAG: hypothetical protein A3H95_06555 [Acidobacteria bacterium RIFCSPLOWO2_02_FULL_64_15]|nr:MAG: hypothetical protein A3H95_06555 [Acidobacteria bacterium RIFCSPLOWO2_02_FULL_64_15]
MTDTDSPQRANIGWNVLDEWGIGALAIVAAGMMAYAAIVLSYLDYVPLWDGRIYADCVLDAAERLSFGALGCAGHNSQAYILPLALAARFAPAAPGSIVPLVVTNVVLGLMALAALARLLGHVLPGRQRAAERALACCAFAVHPLFTASTLQPNIDFGTLVFALPCVCALIERRVMAATVLGCFLVFTKEPALIVYASFVLSALFVLVARPAGTWRAALAECRPFAPLVVPLVLAGVYLAPSLVEIIPDLLWSGDSPPGLAAGAVTARMLIDAIDLNYGLGLFVLSFMWVPTIVIVGDLGVAPMMTRLGGRADVGSPGPGGPTRAIVYGTLVMTLVLTRYKSFSNFRYFLTLYPFFVVICAVALAKRVRWRPARLGVTGVLVVLFAVSNFRTIDPVSRAVFGTFPFGAHDLLDMTANTGECCGHGRDQLVYNLEFTAIATLQDEALAQIRPTADTVLSMDTQANWYTVGPVDPVTFRRTLDRAGAIEPRVLDTRDLGKASSLPEEMFYFAFANVENQQSLAWLADRYTVSAVLAFDERGYTLRVYRMARREG